MKLLPVIEKEELFILPKLKLFANSEFRYWNVIYAH
jgi:hypothetical protein